MRESLEDFSVAAFKQMSSEERSEAIKILSSSLAALDNDPRVVRMLVATNADGLEPLLRNAMNCSNETGIAAASALWTRTADQCALDTLHNILHCAEDSTVRLAAVMELESLGVVSSRPHLWNALEDPSPEVRSVVGSGLLRSVGLEELEDAGPSKLSRLRAASRSALQSVWKPAVRELRQIIKETLSGRSAAELGIEPYSQPESEELQRVRESVFVEAAEPGPWVDRVDIEAFRQLQGEEQAQGRQFLLYLLGERDARAFAAITALGMNDMKDVLREIVENSKNTSMRDGFGERASEALNILEQGM